MSWAMRCDACRQLVDDENGADEFDWSYVSGWFKLCQFDDNGKKLTPWWVCSWDCLAVLMMEKNDIAQARESA